MLKRVICMCLISLLLVSAAMSESAPLLPAVTDAEGQPAAFACVETDMAAPESGDWDRAARAVSGLDKAETDYFSTRIAIGATEMGFNTYTLMTYKEKVSVVCGFIAALNEEALAFYAEGEHAPQNVLVPVKVGAGDFAVVVLKDGVWKNVGMFGLDGDAAAEPEVVYIDLSAYEIGEHPAYLAQHNEREGTWQVVGVNRALVDAAIALYFQ